MNSEKITTRGGRDATQIHYNEGQLEQGGTQCEYIIMKNIIIRGGRNRGVMQREYIIMKITL